MRLRNQYLLIIFKRVEETFSYDINYHFNKNGRWYDMDKIHDDNTLSEHGFVSSIPKDGFIVAIDGRILTAKVMMVTLRGQ